MAHFQAAANEAQPERRDRLRSLNGIADNLIRTSSLPEADSLLGDLCRRNWVLEGSDSVALAETYSLRAYLANYAGRTDSALKYAEQCTGIRSRWLKSGDPLLASGSYLIGIIQTRRGAYQAALRHLLAARTLQASASPMDTSALANTTMSIGVAYGGMGQYSTAMGWLREALPLLGGKRPGELSGAAYCFHSMAVVSRSMGEVSEALKLERRSLEINERLYGHASLQVSAALAQLGDLSTWIGDYEPAHEYYGEALAILSRLRNPEHAAIAEMFRKLSKLALEEGKLDSAYRLITRASEILSKLPESPSTADLFEDRGDIRAGQGKFDQAIRAYTHAVHLRRAGTPSTPFLELAALYCKIGDVYRMEGRRDSSASALHLALLLHDSSATPNLFLKSATFRILGEVRQAEGRFDEALSLYDTSLEVLPQRSADEKALSAKQAVEVFSAKGGLLQERYRRGGKSLTDLAEAITCYDSASLLIARLRNEYRAPESRLALQEEVLPLFASGLSISAEGYLRTGYDQYREAAYRFAERSKAAVLSEMLRDAEVKQSAGIPDSLLRRERQLLQSIADAERKILRGGGGGDPEGEARHRLFAARREWEALQAALEKSSPLYRNQRLQESIVPLPALGAELPPRTVMLSYALSPDSLFLFTISREGTTLRSLGPPQVIEESVRRLRSAIKTFDPVAFLRSARRLYRRLIAPAEAEIASAGRLVIVPDGILHYLPFEALVRSTAIGRTGGATDFASLDYLIKAHEVTYALSSDLFLDAQSRGRRVGDSKWAFAGYAPVFPDSTPPPELAQGIRVDEGQRSVNLEGKTYAELKYSEDEVRAIAAAFHREGDRSEGFFQSGATKKRFLATAGNYSIVHIASHGVIDEDVPALSGILFSPAAGKESADVLYSGEISALHLNAELLVLGVCEGGLGRYVRGEGVMALTRSFASAGARNILYSLWKVYDRPTSDLMQKFYTHLLAGETFSSALRSAKLEMIASAPTAFPLAWAGFVLQGE